MVKKSGGRSRGSGADDRKHYSVYVVALDEKVLEHEKFRDANPYYKGKKGCLYVGMTGLSPEDRFTNHKKGHKANAYVKRYGLYLRRRLFEKYNPMIYKKA